MITKGRAEALLFLSKVRAYINDYYLTLPQTPLSHASGVMTGICSM